jgi:hypothetical protein
MAFGTRIGCNRCGEPVSERIEVPDSFQINAWIECPRCIGATSITETKLFSILLDRFGRQEFLNSTPMARAKYTDAASREIIQWFNNERLRPNVEGVTRLSAGEILKNG